MLTINQGPCVNIHDMGFPLSHDETAVEMRGWESAFSVPVPEAVGDDVISKGVSRAIRCKGAKLWLKAVKRLTRELGRNDSTPSTLQTGNAVQGRTQVGWPIPPRASQPIFRLREPFLAHGAVKIRVDGAYLQALSKGGTPLSLWQRLICCAEDEAARHG